MNKMTSNQDCLLDCLDTCPDVLYYRNQANQFCKAYEKLNHSLIHMRDGQYCIGISRPVLGVLLGLIKKYQDTEIKRAKLCSKRKNQRLPRLPRDEMEYADEYPQEDQPNQEAG